MFWRLTVETINLRKSIKCQVYRSRCVQTKKRRLKISLQMNIYLYIYN